MKPKLRPYLYLCGAVLLAGLVLWLDRPEQSAQPQQPFFPRLDAQQVTTIELEQLLDGVRLSRADGGWNVAAMHTALSEQLPDAEKAPEEFPAESDRVDQILKSLSALSAGAAVSHKADRHDQLQVGKLALQVRAKNVAGDTLATLYIGKAGPDYFSTYIRKEGDDAVYLVADQLQGRFPTRLDVWRDKTIWTIDPDQIQTIELDRLDGGFRLEKTAEGTFVLQSPKEATAIDAAKFTGWLARWTTLRAADFPTVADFAKTGLAKPTTAMTVTLSTGERKVLSIGNDHASGNPYGMVEGSTAVFLLPTDIKEALKIDWSDWITAAK